MESWNQASIEEGRLQFFKKKILDKLEEIRGDLGELRYKLYVGTVEQCDDYQQLREMAELELQLQFIEYAKGMIQEPLTERQVEISDLKKVYSTPQERENIVSEDEDLEDEDLMGMSEEEYQETMAAALRRGELFTPLSVDNPGDMNPGEILAATLEEPTDDELAQVLSFGDDENDEEPGDEPEESGDGSDIGDVLVDGADDEESGLYTEQDTLEKINEGIRDNSAYNFQFLEAEDEEDAEGTDETDDLGTGSYTSDDTSEFLEDDSDEVGEGSEGGEESPDVDEWLDSNYGGDGQFLEDGDSEDEEAYGESGEGVEDDDEPADDIDRWLESGEGDEEEAEGTGLVAGLFEDDGSTGDFESWFGSDGDEDEDGDGDDGQPGLSDDAFLTDDDPDDEPSEQDEDSEYGGMDFLDDDEDQDEPKTVWLGSGATPPVPSELFPPAGKQREKAPPLEPRKIASKSIFTDKGTQKMLDNILGVTGKTSDTAKKAVAGTKRMISEASKRIESSPETKSFFDIGNPDE